MPAPIGLVGVAALDGGTYLLAVMGVPVDSLDGTPLVALLVQADGGVTSAGTYDANSGLFPGSQQMPFVAAGGSAALFFDDDSNGPDEAIGCADPYSATIEDILPPGRDSTVLTVQLSAAAAPAGTLAFAWKAVPNQSAGGTTSVEVYGLSPVDGGCPMTTSNLPTLSSQPSAVWVPSVAATVGDAGAPFLLAETLSAADAGGGFELLGLWTLSESGTSQVASARYGTGDACGSSVVSVQKGPLIVGGDGDAGAFVFTVGDGGKLIQGPQLTSGCASTYNPPALAACGPDCVLSAWFDFPNGCNDEYQPVYAFMSLEGCGVAGTFASFETSEDPPYPLAVASQPGSALIAFGENSTAGSSLEIEYCTSP